MTSQEFEQLISTRPVIEHINDIGQFCIRDLVFSYYAKHYEAAQANELTKAYFDKLYYRFVNRTAQPCAKT